MTNTAQIAKTDLKALLSAVDGNYVEAYNRLVSAVADEAIVGSKRATVADRKNRWSKALAKMDRGLLAKINKTMSTYLRVVKAQTITESDAPRQLTEVEAADLMGEYLALRDITEFLATRKDFMKTAVFAHLTEAFAEQGEEFPEHVNGSVEVPELGFKFCRERTGRTDPTLNEETLKELLGDDFDSIFDVEIKEVRTLNVEKLMKLGRLEEVRAALTFDKGEWKSPAFIVRPITPDKE